MGVEQTICDDGDTCERTNLHKKLIQSRKTLEVLKDELDGTEEGLVDASDGEKEGKQLMKFGPHKEMKLGFESEIFRKVVKTQLPKIKKKMENAKKAMETIQKALDAKTKKFRAKLAVKNLKKAIKEENAVEKAFEKLLVKEAADGVTKK